MSKRSKKISVFSDEGSVLKAKAGDIITFVCGPSESSDPRFADRKGRAYGFIHSQWGTSLRVKLDDYTFTNVERFTTIGIGVYHHPNAS